MRKERWVGDGVLGNRLMIHPGVSVTQVRQTKAVDETLPEERHIITRELQIGASSKFDPI